MGWYIIWDEKHITKFEMWILMSVVYERGCEGLVPQKGVNMGLS